MKCRSEKQEMPASVPVVQQTADEMPLPALVPQTFRLPQRLIEDLARAGELRALSWLEKHFYDRVIPELVDECDSSGTLELPGARSSGDWRFGRECRRTGRLRDSLNAP
jgi:hypothetical protein